MKNKSEWRNRSNEVVELKKELNKKEKVILIC